MKWMTLLPLMFLLTACFYNNSDVVENREIIVSPPNAGPAFWNKGSSIDVTTTRVSY